MKTKLKPIAFLFISGLLFLACSKNKGADNPLQDFGIKSIKAERLESVAGSRIEGDIWTVHRDASGHFWISIFEGGLIRIDPSFSQVDVFNTDNSLLPSNSIWKIDSDGEGVVWMGTSSGLVKFHEDKFEVLNTDNTPQFSGDIFLSFDVDSHDNLWLDNGNAHGGGVLKLDKSSETWESITPQNSDLPEPSVQQVYIDSDDNLWVGMVNAGVWMNGVEGSGNYSIQNSLLDYNFITLFSEDNFGDIWVGSRATIFLNGVTLHGSIQRFDEANFESHYPAESGVSTNRVVSMDFDARNNLWVATSLDAPVFPHPHETLIHNGKKWLALGQELNLLPENLATHFILTEGDIVWLATNKGLYRLKVSYL